MSNPFQEHFQNDPSAQKAIAEEQARLAAEQAKQADDERKRLFKESVIQELRLYQPLALEVLEQLREANYPGMAIRLKTTVDEFAEGNQWEIDTTEWWQLGSIRTESYYHKGFSSYSEKIEPIVSIGLSVDELGKANSFVVACYRPLLPENYSSLTIADSRRGKQLTGLTKDALVKTLIDLHTPDKRSVKIIKYLPIIENALTKFARHTHFQKCFSAGAGFEKSNLLDAPPKQGVALGYLSEVVSESFYNQLYDGFDTRDVEKTYAEVSLVFDGQDTPTHFRCSLRQGTSNSLPLEGVSTTASLDEESLYMQLLMLLDDYDKKSQSLSAIHSTTPEKEKVMARN